MAKKLKIVLAVLLSVIAVLVITFVGIYWQRFASINTLEEVVDGEFYTMDFKADYKLSELLSKNLQSDQIFVDEAIKIMYPLLPIKMQAPQLLCTVFAAENPEGEHIFARNYDLTETNGLLLKTSPKDGYKSISMVDLTIIDCKAPTDLMNKMKLLLAPYATIDGINEKGLGVAALVVKDEPTYQDTGKLPITTNLALRLMLDKAANTDEAVELLSGYDMRASGGSSFHFFITDASGKTVIVEYYQNKMNVVEGKVCTNFHLTENAPEDENKNRCYDRYAIAEKALEESGGVLAPLSAMETLNKARMDETIEGKYIATQWSEIFVLEQGKVYIVLDRDYENVFEFSIDSIK